MLERDVSLTSSRLPPTGKPQPRSHPAHGAGPPALPSRGADISALHRGAAAPPPNVASRQADRRGGEGEEEGGHPVVAAVAAAAAARPTPEGGPSAAR